MINMTPTATYNPLVTRDIISKGLIKDNPFTLIDIGAGGGIHTIWDVFKKDFRAYGFEINLQEVKKLNAECNNPNIKYFNFGIRDINSVWDTQLSGGLYSRTSAYSAAGISKQDPIKYTSIDNFCRDYTVGNIDFIKIDTDGLDLEALVSSKNTLIEKQVLGVHIECQFHGQSKDTSNTFRNIDKKLTDYGYSLFDLDVHRYTKSVLPGEFFYKNLFAQTRTGQVIWGDALYLRDYANVYDSQRNGSLDISKQLKLICLFEIFGLYDCAVELLLQIKESQKIDQQWINQWLDMLTQEQNPEFKTYDSIQEKFRTYPEYFFPK